LGYRFLLAVVLDRRYKGLGERIVSLPIAELRRRAAKAAEGKKIRWGQPHAGSCPAARTIHQSCTEFLRTDMNIDEAHIRAKALCSELEPRLAQIETEQDARFQMINRFLTEVLGWDFSDIRTEPHSPSGYTDYLISSGRQKRWVIEAKRTGALLINTFNPEMRTYKVGGPALQSAIPGVQQANQYCLDHGVNYATITTGLVWVSFIPLPGAGVSFREGKAFVFPNFKSIVDNFAAFYDLFSSEGVSAKRYSLLFAKAAGLSVAEFEPLVAANRIEAARLLTPSPLAVDLEPVFREFFGSMSAETDRDMLINCFVETRESRFADASLEKMVRSVAATIAELGPSADNQLAQEIQAAVDTGRGETVVIVGNNGAGKSTFTERFFDSVLEQALRAQCMVVRIDLLKSTGDVLSISSWLTGQLKSNLENHLYKDGIPTYEELQGLYFREYQRWMKGQYKPLYDSDKNAFKVKFSDFLNEQIDKDPYTYVLRLLNDIVKNRKSLPCLIFDNGDHFDLKFQEAVFQYSQAIHKSLSFTFIVMPITDRSFWRLSKAGPFQTYSSKMFYLPMPPTKEVLEKRVAYLKRKIEEHKDQHKYFLTKGIRLSFENIKGFAACLEEVFIQEDFVARRISWLANNNIRKSLQIAQKVIMSPFFSIEDLVKAFIAGRAGAPIRLNYQKFMQALLLGNYNVFRQDHNEHILNMFAISPHVPTSPLLKLSILKMLIDRAGEQEGVSSYISIEQCRQYFDAASLSEAAVDYALETLLSFRLIEPYDASDDSIVASQRVAVTHAGRMHYELATTDQFFVSDMAYATPVRNLSLVEKLRALKSQKMGTAEWQVVEGEFVKYCVDQDAIFVRLPKDEMFDGQRQLRSDIIGRWIKSEDGVREVPVEESALREAAPGSQAGFSHLPAVVKWFNTEKGYGFVEAGVGQDVFLHQSVLQQTDIQSVMEGDTLICDIAQGHKGRLQIIAVHSMQKREAMPSSTKLSEQYLEGVVEFYNSKKGYGFVKTLTLPDDVYVSGRILEQSGLTTLVTGVKVKIGVEPGRFGKGFMATSVALADEAAAA
jgi:cold shock CspA family protein